MHNVYHNFNNITDQDKFVYLMKFHWKEVSLYLEKAWDKRKKNLIYAKIYENVKYAGLVDNDKK